MFKFYFKIDSNIFTVILLFVIIVLLIVALIAKDTDILNFFMRDRKGEN